MSSEPYDIHTDPDIDIYSEINVPFTEGKKNRLCLVMIVRQEEPVIRRTFTCMNHLFDSFIICDTGSTDNTLEVMHEWLTENGKSGYLIRKSWIGYGPNKCYNLRLAYEKGMAQGADYITFLDADEVFIRSETTDSMPESERYPTADTRTQLLELLDSRPSDGIFMLQTLYGNNLYYRWNFLRNNQRYRWRMPVQEFLCATQPCGTHYIDPKFMYLWARKQGCSSRIDRTQWEADTLIKFCEETQDPSHPDHDCYSRGLFYLGQICEWAPGKIQVAFDAYEKRLLVDGYYDEKFIARLRLARMYRARSAEDPTYIGKAEKHLQDAIKFYPARLEAYHELMMLYDSTGRRPQAYEVAVSAKDSLVAPNGSLFVEQDIYSWRFLFNAGAIAWWVGQYAISFYWTTLALQGNGYGEGDKKQMLANIGFAKNDMFKHPSSTKDIAQVCLRTEMVPLDIFATGGSGTGGSGGKGLTANAHNFYPNVVVVNSFFADVDAVRAFALRQTFNVVGNYPGKRTKSFQTEAMKQNFEKILGKRISYWPTDGYNGSFQLCTEEQSSWIHRDATQYSAIIYLTPDAPADAGTTFFKNKTTGECYETPETRDYLNSKSRSYDDWTITNVTSCQYGSVAIVNGFASHQSSKYFGKDLYTGRLFMLFFFDVEISPEDRWKLTADKPPSK